MADCVFCMIANHEIPSTIVYAKADKQAQKYWDNSLFQTDGSPEARLKWAKSQTSDKAVLESLSALGERARQQEFAQQAQAFLFLASAGTPEEARKRLALSPLKYTGAVARAVSQFGAPAPHASAGTFNRLYFSGTEKENERAFEKGEVSAQEFLALSAAYSSRQAGADDKTGAFLCAGIESWAQKKGLSTNTQDEIKREVLCSSADPQERLNALKQIKTYFDL